YYAGDNQTRLRLIVPVPTSLLGLQKTPEGLQAATKPWIYSSAGCFQASSITDYSSEPCPPSTTLHGQHPTQTLQNQTLSSWIKLLEATFTLTFDILSRFQFPAYSPPGDSQPKI
ncbi:hypothetical protein GOODEAATRI_019214, partial [Goodea atripinnis]